MIVILYIYLYCINLIVCQSIQQANFRIISQSIYIPQFSWNFLINLTSITISTKIKCATECLKNEICQTATYYEQIKTCSIYSEKSNVGQILNVVNQTSYVITMNTRIPTICHSSSQSSWTSNAITIIGNSSGISGSGLSQLNSPIQIYYDKTNRIMIIGDNGNLRVMKFFLNNPSSTGIIIAGGNGVGCNLNQFKNIVGIAIDSFQQLYTSDSSCSRILRFPPNSNSTTYGTVISSPSLPQGLFINPLTDDLYVAVYGESSILKFSKNSTQGIIVAGGNGGGNGLNQVNSPNNIYFDFLYTNSLYVADTGNNRILKFPSNSTNKTLGIIVAGTGSSGNASNRFNYPRSVIIDRNGILYISDGYNGRIQRWLPNATSGDTIAGGSTGNALNQLNFPEAILFDENNNLLVSDRGNNRIQLFNISVC